MPQPEQDKRKPQEEIVDGEIVAEFRDETLMNLPKLPGEDEAEAEPLAPPVIAPPSGEGAAESGRRRFVVQLAMGGVAALALGGSAALLLQKRGEPNVVVLPNGTQIDVDGSVDVASLAQQIADLQRDLAAVTAERDQYLSDLSKTNPDVEGVRQQLEQARQMIGLWQQLDAIGLDDVLVAALQSVGVGWAAVLTVVGLLKTGLADAENRLDSFAANFPNPQSGIVWLQEQIGKLGNSLDQLAEQFKEAIEPVEPYTKMIADFVMWVLERLPFGAGAKAKAGMEGMQTIVSALPGLVSGINTTVLVPLADWFGKDANRNLLGILVSPLLNQLVKPAQDMLTKLESYQTSYQDQLALPVQTALEQRAAIREQIQQAQTGAEG